MTEEKVKKGKSANARYREWARDCQKATTTDHILTLARSRLLLDPEKFDADPWLLNCQNGTVDLQTGELHSHQAEDMLTMMAGTTFDPQARAPLWGAFLDRILGGSEELVNFVQKAAGYSLTGLTTEQVFFVLYGTGANGKSTFTGVFTQAMGDYGKALPRGLLTAQKFEAHPTILADLFRVRMAVSSEVKAGSEWDEERIKALTGGDMIKARRMREDFWEYSPSHKIWLATNHQPLAKDNSEGFWRRLRMVPFTVTIPEQERDPMLMEKLRAELPGILAWAIRGCLAWQAEGLESPDEVRAATRDYRDRQDPFGRFLAGCCNLNGDARVQASDLHKAYEQWARASDEKPLSSKELAAVMQERGFQSKKSSVQLYTGLCLREAASRPSHEWEAPGDFKL